MVIALVRSQSRLLTYSILHYLPQASTLQPRSDGLGTKSRAFGKQADKLATKGRKRKDMRCSSMSSISNSTPVMDDRQVNSTYQLARKFRYVSDTHPTDFVFRLVSYNLLAQHQIEKNSYLYDHCTEKVLQWEWRKEALFEEIKSLSCDILCLQEVQTDHYDEALKPFFSSLGFESHFKSKTREGHDGVAVGYRRSKFSLLEVELVEFHRSSHSVLRADNVGIVLLLQPLPTPDTSTSSAATLPPICVANTHLYFNANRGDVKLAQLSLLLATIERMAKRESANAKYHPVLLCGDFNSEPTSPLFKFLVSGRLPDLLSLKKSAISDQNLTSFWGPPSDKCLSRTDLPPPGVGLDCRFKDDRAEEEEIPNESEDEELEEGEIREEIIDLSHPFKFATAMPVPAETNRDERYVTSFTTHDVCCVDHIFYTPSGLRLVLYYETVKRAEFIRVSGIPNSMHPSDHIPLLVDFTFRSKEENGKRKKKKAKKSCLSHRL